MGAAAALALGQLPMSGSLPASEECLVSLPLQNARAVSLGDTFYLPKSAGGAQCPAAIRWKIKAAPAGSQNSIYNQGSEHPRFTADVAGDYEFSSVGGGYSFTMKAVQRSAAERFRNHYLTPLYGAAQVGSELWTANGASYTVTRVQKSADGSLQKTAEVATGAWPAAVIGSEALPYVLVAQRGADTIGFVDRQRNVLVDALWVGDEPTGLALSPDSRTLYVSLATERSIAVVDLAKRTLKPRIAVGFDPRALALSADGNTLYAASYRSANLEYGPGGSRPAAEDQDIFVVDTRSGKMVRTIGSVAADLRAITLSPDGQQLFVAATDGQTLPSQADPTAKPFIHMVAALAVAVNDAGRPESVQLADLTRQEGSTGPFVNPSGIAVQGDQLWVASESSNQVAILDRASMVEKMRIDVGSGPRQIVVMKDAVAVHCFQSFELYILNFDGSVRQVVKLTEDPRNPAIALGEKVFMRPGNTYATNHSCTSCHIEAQNDGMIWRFGPNVWHNVRPLQILAATTSLGWTGYASNADSFGFMGPSSILNRPPTNEEAAGLSAFLNSLIGAPRSTDRTRLDGSFSELGLKGKALFENEGKCTSCHVPPLYTNRVIVPKGKSGEPAEVASLLGAYRHGVFFMNGGARSLEDAVDVATNFVGWTPDAEEKTALVSFLKELTPKGAAPLGMFPDLFNNDMIPATVRPYVGFAEPVDDTRPGLSAVDVARPYVSLKDASGAEVPATLNVNGGRLELVPEQALTAGERYTFRVKAGLPFRDGGVLEGDRSSSFIVARPAAVTLPKDLVLKVMVPVPGPPTVPPAMKEVPLSLQITGQDANGIWAKLDITGGRMQMLRLYQDGDRLRLQAFALPMGGPPGSNSLADASAVTGKLVLNAEQGETFTKAQGTLTIGAPGIKVPQVPWTLEAAPAVR
jgi:DNA-binding beta-propeller fold protein YncE